MKIPINYSFRNMWTRKLTTSMTITGVALVVFVFAAVLMLANGLQNTLIATGSADNAIFLRKSAESETLSSISRDAADLIETQPEIAMGSDGKPVSSKELVVIINLYKRGSNDMANVTVRGVSAPGLTLRPQVKLTAGRMFNFGSSEIIVGNEIAHRFDGTAVGQTMRFGGRTWTIVGEF
ncbi:MAG TPA: ABC transporter permease, partial [Candidatus Kapabacteria bacterium]|nr:ABC transporter permease [Candidatus Kapabacteria bacterium]